MICNICGAKILTIKTWFDAHEKGTCVGYLLYLLSIQNKLNSDKD